MIDHLLSLDTKTFLFLNSLHDNWLDSIMLAVSYNYLFMGIFLIMMLALTTKHYGKKILPLFFILLIIFGLSDSISTRVFKNNIKRLRPCHEPQLKNQVHLAGKKCWGGKFGFVSSHAANSFAISTFFFLILRNTYPFIWLIFLYSSLVGYSRIYLAKHYPLDIICGAFLGFVIAYSLVTLARKKFRVYFFGT